MQQIESLALFPLSNVVLLPEVSVPLYVFEPRYRQLTRDALEGGQRIGMATVRPEAATSRRAISAAARFSSTTRSWESCSLRR